MENLKICVVGLGYVGGPLFELFSTKYTNTIGFDLSVFKVAEYGRKGLNATNDIDRIKDCNFYVIAVPTPVDANNKPDLNPLISASRTVASVLNKGDIVVYESTVYPGATEEVCVPVLEEGSGYKYNCGFYVGYSPERINPGDKEHVVANIKKITSGSTPEVADLVDRVYSSVLANGTFKATSIKVAECAKAIENTQRDVNIALVNELSSICNKLGIETMDVIEAASTKWNFMKLHPGLVGGHCISVDPYYLMDKANSLGVDTPLIRAAREVNESMPEYVIQSVWERYVDKHAAPGLDLRRPRILVLGITFKENCEDIRNSKSAVIVNGLPCLAEVDTYDPWASRSAVEEEYGIKLIPELPEYKYDIVILTVNHREFKDLDYRKLFNPKSEIILFDVQRMNFVDPNTLPASEIAF